MTHPRLPIPRQLHESDIRGVRKARTVRDVRWIEARMAKRFRQKREAAFGDAFDDRADEGLVEGAEQRGEHRVRGVLVADL